MLHLALLTAADLGPAATSLLAWLFAIVPFVLTTWYAQGSGKYDVVTWNDDSMGGGSNGTPASGDTVDSNSNTIGIRGTITNITFSSGTWNIDSGDTATLRGCTLNYPLGTMAGNLVIDTNITYYLTTFGYGFQAAVGSSVTINYGAQLKVASGAMMDWSLIQPAFAGLLIIDCTTGQSQVQLRTTYPQWTGAGGIALDGVTNNFTSYPIGSAGLLAFEAQGVGGGTSGPVGRSSGV